MRNKSDSRNANRGQGGQKPDREQGGGNWNDHRQQGRQEGSVNLKDHQNQNREVGSGNMNDAQQQSPAERFGNMRGSGGFGGFRKMFQGNNRAGQDNNPTKNGCLPKLFMLILPVMTIATFLFLKS
jgi:hypothetical protein